MLNLCLSLSIEEAHDKLLLNQRLSITFPWTEPANMLPRLRSRLDSVEITDDLGMKIRFPVSYIFAQRIDKGYSDVIYKYRMEQNNLKINFKSISFLPIDKITFWAYKETRVTINTI